MVPRRAARLAAALAAVAMVAACTDSGTDGDSASARTTTTGEGRGAGGGSGAAPARTLDGWARSTSEALNDAEPSGTLKAVLAPGAGAGWVVAGTAFDAGGVPRATVWRSDDALTWKATPVGGVRTEGYGATRRADGALVVVGRELVGTEGRAAAWVEENGRFSRAGGGDALAGGSQVSMDGVAARPAGLVAVGRRSREGGEDGLAVWRSSTGVTWERLPDAEAVFAASGQAFVNALVAVPAGFVAVGGVRKGDDVDAAVWFSPDGTAWRAAASAADFTGPGAQSVNDVVALDGGLLAVGSTSDGRRSTPAAWLSPDGQVWAPGGATFQQLGQASDTSGTEVTTVRRVTRGLVATGGGDAVNRLWGSGEGTTWQEIPLPGEAAAADNFDLDLLAASGDDVVAASAFDGAPRVVLLRAGRYTEVTATAKGFPAPRPDPSGVEVAAAGHQVAAAVDVTRSARALGTERNEVTVLASEDGLAWTAARGGPVRRVIVSDVGVDPDGRVVGVGGLAPPRTAGGRHAFATYVLDKGAWRQEDVVSLPGDDPDEGGSRYFEGVATRDDRMVVAGNAFVGSGGAGNVDGAIFTKVGSGRLSVVENVPGLTGPGDEIVNTVCAGGRGFLVAGSVRNRDDRDAALWFSADGRAWQQVTAPSFGGPGDQNIVDCAATAAGFVAAGGVSTGDLADAAVWTSPDGLAWARVEAPVLAGDDAQIVSALSGAGPEVIAVGTDSRLGAYTVAMWHSGDSGATWDRVELGKPFVADRYSVATSVVVAGDRVVVGGLVDDRAATWAGPWPLRRSA